MLRWILSRGAWGPLLVAAVVVVNIGVYRGTSTFASYEGLGRSRDVLNQTVEQLRLENERISEEIMRLKKSPGYARKILRDKYHVTELDESIVFFAD